MKDLLLRVHVVAKTLNLKMSRCHLADYNSKNCNKMHAAWTARLFFPIQPIRSLFSGVIIAIAIVLA